MKVCRDGRHGIYSFFFVVKIIVLSAHVLAVVKGEVACETFVGIGNADFGTKVLQSA